MRAIRDNPQAFDAGLARRGAEPAAARIVELDERRREVRVHVGRDAALFDLRERYRPHAGHDALARQQQRPNLVIDVSRCELLQHLAHRRHDQPRLMKHSKKNALSSPMAVTTTPNRPWLFAAALLFVSSPAYAQYTTRTGTICVDVVATFDEARNKGVAITGRPGDPVVAAADGRVVYAGSGLRGYGNLVIVKHNATYLTAYAHNQALLVKEDQVVRRGQKIAEMGASDAERVQLHFEIRRQGKPVDPSKLLPARTGKLSMSGGSLSDGTEGW